MGKILNDLERLLVESVGDVEEIEEEKITGFSMEVDDNEYKYKVMLKGKEICTAEFVDNRTEDAEDLDKAQQKPEDYTVYLSDVKDDRLADKYAEKLTDMGFERVSI